MSETPLCQADALTVKRGPATVLDGVSLQLVPGRITAVLGPNGAGKSSLVAALAGDLKPFSGNVLWNGKTTATWDRLALARLRAVVLQENTPAFDHTAAEVTAFGLLPWAGLLRPDEETALVREALAALDAAHLADRPITRLSVGERQRVHLARALVQLRPAGNAPRALLLDEPGAALDPRHQLLLLRHLRKLAQNGAAVLMIVHDVNLALRHADHALVLANGNVAASGPAGETLSPALLETVFGLPARWAASGPDRWLVLG